VKFYRHFVYWSLVPGRKSSEFGSEIFCIYCRRRPIVNPSVP